MALFESLFNILYLSFVIGLGIHLVFQDDNGAKLFGFMGILLGLGDSFHLIPRVISHWSLGGFEANAFILSWGKAITSVTMTIFYLLYYYFLRRQSRDKNKIKDYLVYGLVIIRIALIMLPQNEWGTMPGNYIFSILRNIPFAILGILLIVWSYKYRNVKGLKYMGTLISLSFLFYAPVVLWVNEVPMLGAFMIPKTVAYFLIVYMGYKNFVPKFGIKRIVESSFVYLIFGLSAGVFYREFSKAYNFSGASDLGKIHVHIITLGVVSLLILYIAAVLLLKSNPNLMQALRLPLSFWNFGLAITVAIMIIRGMIQILDPQTTDVPSAAISGMAGIGHIILGLGMVLSFRVLVKARIDYDVF